MIVVKFFRQEGCPSHHPCFSLSSTICDKVYKLLCGVTSLGKARQPNHATDAFANKVSQCLLGWGVCFGVAPAFARFPLLFDALF